MSNLVDVIQSLINRISLEIEVVSIALPRVYVCDTKHITVGKIVTDESNNQYIVTAFEPNEWVELSPFNNAPDFAGTVIIAPSILFLHGTPKSTNNEYLQIETRTLKKTPLIWLLESYNYEDPAADSSLEAIFDVRAFLLDWCDLPKWSNDQHNENAIKPMEALRDSLIEVINSDYSFKRVNRITTKVRPRFGVEVTDQGNNSKIINEDFSGIEIRFDLEAYDLSGCKC